MCGIAGAYRLDGGPVEADVLTRMAAVLEHRGPDGEGFWRQGHVGFAHRRLSIIDLAHSQQPMHDASGRLHLTFNGEIFNYRELRHSTGDYPYRTSGDTEAILACWARRGPSAVSDMVGQFAFALYDGSADELWLCRDRLGVLPLYYYVADSTLYFASEVKAIAAALGGPPPLDPVAVADYLSARSVYAPHTLFRGVRKLLPGSLLRVSGRRVGEPERYWELPTATTQVSDDEAVELVRDRLVTALERSLIADVPVGAYLSGGLDSSVTVALVRKLYPDAELSTFAAGFGDERLDELPYARQVATRLGSRHHEVVVGPEDFMALWSRLSWYRDAPISEASDVAVFQLAKLARQHVKVVLSGEGSDELFAGYPKHRFARLDRSVGVLPHGLRRFASRAVEQRLPASLARARVAVRALGASTTRARHLDWFAPFSEQERAELLGRRTARTSIVDGVPLTGDPLSDMLRIDMHTWLPDNLLERGDRMSMGNSLELRPPFLDRDLVELAFRLPNRVKLRKGVGKWVVRRLADDLLPREIIDRKKLGFRVPLDRWFQAGLRDYASDRLLDSASLSRRLFDQAVVEKLISAHVAGRQDNSQQLWTLLCLEVWHDAFYRERDWSLPVQAERGEHAGDRLADLRGGALDDR